MSIIVKFGFRTYEFYSDSDVIKAQALWCQPCDQNQFEEALESHNIDFDYVLD